MLETICNFFADTEEKFMEIATILSDNGYTIIRQGANIPQGIAALPISLTNNVANENK